MSQDISFEEIKKFWPNDAPDINNVQKYVLKYKEEKIVIKYGGNVLIDRNVFDNFVAAFVDVITSLISKLNLLSILFVVFAKIPISSSQYTGRRFVRSELDSILFRATKVFRIGFLIFLIVKTPRVIVKNINTKGALD